MQCIIKLKNRENIEINDFKEVTYYAFEGHYTIAANEIEKLDIGDDINYTFTGDKIFKVQGKHVLYIVAE